MALGRLALAAAALLVAAACDAAVAPTPTPSVALSGAPPGVDMTDALQRTKIPAGDWFDLTRRVAGRDGAPGPWQPVVAAPPTRAVGERRSFWVYNERQKENVQLATVLRLTSDHAYWYLQEGVQVDPAKLQQSLLEFEGKVYPTDHRLLGEEWIPGIDADPRLSIVMVRTPDVGGYFNADDELPRWVNRYSNEMEGFYVNIDGAAPGTPSFADTTAHELAHLIEYNKRVATVVWFNEGQAQLAENWNGYNVFTIPQYLRLPDTQLTDWHDTAAESGANYGHAFLFLEYLAERFGGPPVIRAAMEHGVETPRDLEPGLGGARVEDLYLDFAATLGLLDQPDAPAPYRYPSLHVPAGARVSRDPVPSLGTAQRGTVHQYATRYYDLPAGAFAVDLTGATQVRLLPTDPHSGKWLWWSNRADGSDMRLTRAVDLSGVDRATLDYWTWYDIETNFDYAYVEASADGGKTWRTLRTPSSTDRDPNGANLGKGITGLSGGGTQPAWVEQRVDLSPYARQRILLRFEYVTDQALNKDGFAIDDLSIPEVGWTDDAESDGGWTAEGFVRSSNLVGERFAAQAITLGDHPAVTRATTDATGRLHLDVTVPDRGGLLAVTAFAAETTQPGAFELRVTKK